MDILCFLFLLGLAWLALWLMVRLIRFLFVPTRNRARLDTQRRYSQATHNIQGISQRTRREVDKVWDDYLQQVRDRTWG